MSTIIVPVLLAAGLGLLLGYLAFGRGKGGTVSADLQQKITEQERALEKIEGKISEAKNQVKAAELEAKAAANDIINKAKLDATEIQSKQKQDQVRIEEQQKALEIKGKELERDRGNLATQKKEIDDLKTELSDASAKHREALEKVAKLTQEQAKQELLTSMKAEYGDFFAQEIKTLQGDMESEAEAKAKNILAEAMQRYAAEVASESTSTIVQLPADDMKGKIIGKEGRNIIAFEQATGVDVIIDDTPGAIIISGFDLARRYVAKLAMEKLLQDGRIQPARIEEVVAKVKEQVGKMMLEFGKRAVDELGITGYPQDLLKIIGRLRFRTSYGQNVLKHSVEMAHIGKMVAEELGADVQVVVEGCLLHDIGKALDHEVQGTHVEIGVNICKRYKVRPEVIHCVAAHHEDIPFESPEAFIVAAADAISGARPGARRESIEEYFRRLKELEELAKGFPGVHRAFAVSAGREIRIYVDTQKVDDLGQAELAKNIARKIEEQLTYPGIIKVNVIRERRVEEMAK